MNFSNNSRNKYYSSNNIQVALSAFEENVIFKNTSYKMSKGYIIGLKIVGKDKVIPFVNLKQCIREKKEKTKQYYSGYITEETKKFYSYTPVVDDSQYDYFKEGIFNATEEEKVKFGLIFNDLDAYTMCLNAFKEAEDFYESHTN